MGMARLADRAAPRLAIFALLALAVVWTMLPSAGWLNEFRDAQVLTLHERAAVDAVRRFGQLPLWDPYYCGGLYGLGAPQSRFASPPFLLSLLFGVERAEPLIIYLFTILGMEGTFRWLRLRVVDATAAIRIAPLFALSGYFAVAFFRGWINFFGFELVPFVLLGITLASRGRTSGIVVAAVAFAIILGFGGTFAAPLIAVAVVVEAIRAISEQPPSSRLRAGLTVAGTFAFMAALSAVRLLPIAETLAAQPRLMAGTPGHPPIAILWFLVRALEANAGDIDDAGNFYVGGAFLALVALGGSDRKSIRPLIVVIVFMWLSAGYARKPALFALLRELPVFSALRYPERFLWLAILYACEPAAHALARLPRLGEGRRWRHGANAVLTLGVLVTLVTQIAAFVELGKARELGVVAVDRLPEFRQARGNRWLAAHYDGIGAGSLSCWETHPVTMSSKLRADLAAEEYVEDPLVGIAQRRSWSPNELVVHVTMARAGRLLVNQNWHPGWRASVGNVVSDEGLLAVDLPPGEADVTLRFRPRSALTGAVVSLVALVALAALALGARRGRVPFRRGAVLRTALLVLAPWATLAAFVVTWSEPRYPPAPQRNADGSPALVAAVPPEALPLGAQFSDPVVIDAVRFEGPDAIGNVAIDLWLRRTGALSRTTAMFVHVVRRSDQEPVPPPEPGGKEKARRRDFYNADHQVVGGSFYLSDAPEGRLVHDAFGVHLDHAARGAYDVWLGFGHVSGRKHRATVVEAGATTVNGDTIRIGSFVVH